MKLLQYFILVWSSFTVLGSNGRLISVTQVFRHGERTPILFYPTDPYQYPEYWNGLSPGKLTEVGKQQLYNLGQYFRNRYDSFIGNEYIDTKISMKSSNSDRNKQSAQSFLEGLHENSEIPIEVSAIPVVGNFICCLKFLVEYLKSEAENEEFLQINIDNREFYRYLNKYTEMPIFGLGTSFVIFDSIHIESGYDMDLPDWIDTIWPEPLGQISKNFSRMFCQTEEQQKLGAGGFLNELIEQFDMNIEGSTETKTFLYSGHDINLICLLSVFDYYKKSNVIKEYPTFASSIIFELRQNEETNNYFVNTFYKPSVEDEEIPLSVRGCDIDCELNTFKDLFSEFRIKKEEWWPKCFYLGINAV